MSTPEDKSGELVGFCDLLGQFPSFVLPLLRLDTGDNRLWAQQISAGGVITGFDEVSVPNTSLVWHKGPKINLGNEALWGFRWTETDYLIVPEREMQSALLKRGTLNATRDKPFLNLELVEFCDLSNERPRAIRAASQALEAYSIEWARIWREDNILTPACKRLIRNALHSLNATSSAQDLERVRVTTGSHGTFVAVPATLKRILKTGQNKEREILRELSEIARILDVNEPFFLDESVLVDPKNLYIDIKQELPALRAYARQLTSQDPEDLVQESIVNALQTRKKWQSGSGLQSWLRHLVMQAYKMRKTSTETESSNSDNVKRLMEQWIAAAPAQDDTLMLDDFRNALTKLKPIEREILLLVVASGFTLNEAAQIVGISPSQARERLRSAQKRLAKLLSYET